MGNLFSTKIFACLLTISVLLVLSFFLFEPVFAANKYVLLVGIPGYGTGAGAGETVSLIGYLNAVIKVGIILAAILAVIKIIIAGFMYITAGGSSGKTEQAKQMIWDALVGVFIAAGFYLILMAINPGIINTGLNICTVMGDGTCI